MPNNTTEHGLETLIVNYLVEQNQFEQGQNSDYNREYAIMVWKKWRNSL